MCPYALRHSSLPTLCCPAPFGERRCLLLSAAIHSAGITSTGNSGALVAMYNAVIRPFMPAHTREKLHVVGKDLVAAAPKLELEEDTMRALLEQTGLAKPAEPEVVALS